VRALWYGPFHSNLRRQRNEWMKKRGNEVERGEGLRKQVRNYSYSGKGRHEEHQQRQGGRRRTGNRKKRRGHSADRTMCLLIKGRDTRASFEEKERRRQELLESFEGKWSALLLSPSAAFLYVCFCFFDIPSLPKKKPPCVMGAFCFLLRNLKTDGCSQTLLDVHCHKNEKNMNA